MWKRGLPLLPSQGSRVLRERTYAGGLDAAKRRGNRPGRLKEFVERCNVDALLFCSENHRVSRHRHQAAAKLSAIRNALTCLARHSPTRGRCSNSGKRWGRSPLSILDPRPRQHLLQGTGPSSDRTGRAGAANTVAGTSNERGVRTLRRDFASRMLGLPHSFQ